MRRRHCLWSHLIDETSSGTEVTPGDVNKSGKLDVVVGHMIDVFLFILE